MWQILDIKNKTKNAKFDYLLLLSSFGLTNSGYVDRHIIYLGEQLKIKGYKVAILLIPLSALTFLNLRWKHHSISLRKYLLSLVFNIPFFSGFLFLVLFRTIGKKYDSAWKSNLSVKIYFSRTKLLEKTERVVFNSDDVAYFLTKYIKDIKTSYYIIYHNHENDFPNMAQTITACYEYPFKKIVTNDEMLHKFNLEATCKMVPAVDGNKISSPVHCDKVPNTVLIPLRKNPIKGAIFAIEAIKKVLDRNSKITVYTFGDYPSEYSHKRYVHFGTVSDDQLKKLYAQSEIFVLPSIEDGVPGPALEAMACGCAVICTSVSGAREIITDGYNGLIIPAGDSNIMAEKILKLVDDKKNIRGFIENSKGVVDKFSPTNMTDTFLRAVSFYEKW